MLHSCQSKSMEGPHKQTDTLFLQLHEQSYELFAVAVAFSVNYTKIV